MSCAPEAWQLEGWLLDARQLCRFELNNVDNF